MAPDLLMEDKKKQRVLCLKELLIMFELGGSKWLCNITTGDEMSLFFDGIQNKGAKQVWVGGKKARRTANFQAGFQSHKWLFPF